MPGHLITKNAENDKITKYDDTPVGVDCKKGYSGPAIPFFLHISQGKKKSKIFYFFVDMSYACRIYYSDECKRRL